MRRLFVAVSVALTLSVGTVGCEATKQFGANVVSVFRAQSAESMLFEATRTRNTVLDATNEAALAGLMDADQHRAMVEKIIAVSNVLGGARVMINSGDDDTAKILIEGAVEDLAAIDKEIPR